MPINDRFWARCSRAAFGPKADGRLVCGLRGSEGVSIPECRPAARWLSGLNSLFRSPLRSLASREHSTFILAHDNHVRAEAFHVARTGSCLPVHDRTLPIILLIAH